MAKGKLTPESKALFAKKIAATAKAKSDAKAKSAGVNPEKTKSTGTRSYEQIMKDIAEVRATPAFKQKEKAYADYIAKQKKELNTKKKAKAKAKVDP